LKSKSGVVNVTVDNPLCEITNVGSRSGSCVKTSDLDRDVISIDKENVTAPDSVSPSPFRHHSRFVRSKVYFIFSYAFISLFFKMLTFYFQFSQGIENGSQNSKDEVSF
jgi:hypothetical protein